jgi:bifunctional N-acetylglucosamine-1-phosphate-uridyltransferase/glucosamine-1-phosphate-acetyltransferase GlmU-like protein
MLSETQTGRQRWLLIGERGSLPENVFRFLKSEEGPAVESSTVISGEFVRKDPNFSLTIVRTLLENGMKVYYMSISLPNLLLEDEGVFEIHGSTVREAQGANGRVILHQVKWILTRKYLMVSGTVETMDFREPDEVWVRLRDKIGYRNVVLDSAGGQDVRVGDSLEVIGLYFIGENDFPVIEAVWTEKCDRDALQVSK